MISLWNVTSWLIAILVTLITAILLYIQNRMTYLKRHGFPHAKPKFFWGNMKGKYFSDVRALYDRFKSDASPVFGMYILCNPTIVIKDLDLIKSVLIKDFNTFPERGMYHNKKIDKLSSHLFSMDKEGWKPQRSKLTPTFTSGKMKYMFSTVSRITVRLADALEQAIGKEDCHDIEMKEYLARYGTDVIGNVAFGIECNSLIDPNAEFRKYGKKIVSPDASGQNILMRIFKANFTKTARFFGIRNSTVDVQEFVFRIVRETMESRRDGSKRNDFMDLLLELKKSDANPDGLEISDIAAHTYVFFVAGFETTSTLMGFALYELSINPDIQQKVRDEVNKVAAKHDGVMTYESLEEMTYLEQVINETLRMYSPVIELNRRAVSDFHIPDTNLTIEAGMRVMIPISSIHHDAKYYPDPEKFMPERFSPEEFKQRHPMCFLPFGDGPRNCIGLRFGRMQAKLGLATLLKRFAFTPGDRQKVPLDMLENTFFRMSRGGLWFKVRKLDL